MTPSKTVKKKPAAAAEHQGLGKREIEELAKLLVGMREKITGQIESLKTDAVQDHDSANWEEDGTDAFDREFALKLADSKGEALNQITDALKRVEDGSYGICEVCSEKISRQRMKALPFCRTCIACQSEAEKHRPVRRRAMA